MSNSSKLSEALDFIRSRCTIKKETSTDLIVRCIFCGDSTKHRNSAHLYISTRPVNGVFMYHCFRAECGATGTLVDLLRYLDYKIDKDLIYEIYQASKSSSDKIGYVRYEDIDVGRQSKFYDTYKYKIDYIKDRLCLDDIPQWILNTVVVDFGFLSGREKPGFISRLNTSYVGFLFYDKTALCCRCIDSTGPRYLTIKLKDKIKYYCTSPRLDELNLLENGTIVMAEGVFTLISGYMKILSQIDIGSNVLLVAVNGFGNYARVYQQVISDFLNPEWDVIILSDCDVKPSDYRRILNRIKSKVSLIYPNDGDFADKNNDGYYMVRR